MFSHINNEKGNASLVGLLIAVALVVGIAAFLFTRGSAVSTTAVAEKQGLVQPKQGQTIVGASLDKGKETECQSNLRQIRSNVDIARTTGDQIPASLQDMKLNGIIKCPISGQLYQYDPSSGQVRCATKGHEGL